MKIALIIMDLQLGGGAEHDVVNLSTGLHKAGHTPIVITSGGRLCSNIEAEGITVIRCPVDQRSFPQLRRNARLLADIAIEHKIDVLNPQGVYPALSCYWASRQLISRGRLVPNVVTIHMLGKLTWWYYKLGAHVLNYCAEHIIFESECERNRLLSRGLRRPLTVVPNCFPSSKLASVTDTREDVRKEFGCPQDAVLFVMPARMTPEKRHDLLIQTLADAKCRSLPIRFWLAGDGPLLETYKSQVQGLGLVDRISFLGFRRDLPRLYKAADVFLLCSSAESLPLSIREGMGASLPVIATNVGGIPEAVEDGRSGILVPSGDSSALASAIQKLATDSALRLEMGSRGNQIYREKFDYDRWIARTVEVMSAVRSDYVERHSR